MNIYLLDAGGAGLLYYGLIVAAIFMVIAIFIEAIVMTLFKYNVFRKSLKDSFIANLLSFIVGIILLFSSLNIDNGELSGLLIFYAVTLAIETPVLYLMNKSRPPGKTVLVSVVMNLISYVLLYLFAIIL